MVNGKFIENGVLLTPRYNIGKYMKILLSILLSILLFTTSYAGEDVIFVNGFESPASCVQEILFEEHFNKANQNSWAGLWQESGNEVDVAEITGGQGRLIPVASGYSLARMYHPLNEQDIETTFSFVFENGSSQGVGFYVRGNAGYLQQTNPTGQGYAVFLERFAGNQPAIGLWYENNGNEISFIRDYDPDYQLLDNIKYNVRFQIFQLDANNTRLRARVWQDGQVEPNIWHVSVINDFIPLQNQPGVIAVDSWSTQNSGQITNAIRVDDIVVSKLCNPLLNITAPVTLENNLQFAEGPVWQNDYLLFSDIDANTIYKWQQGSGLTVFNANSGNSNGLTINNQNQLVAAEHGNRRLSIFDGVTTTTLVDNYQGDAFNSPNDIAISTTSVVYFTDPDYGLNGGQRELDFNGVFRYHPQNGLTVEYEGNSNGNKPNGIVLSLDESQIFWSDTQTGMVHTMEVGINGELSNITDFANNLNTPDGMCVDKSGNIFVATWNGALEVYAQNGDYWGSLAMPEDPITNCTFGGINKNLLFVTGRNALYQSQVVN